MGEKSFPRNVIAEWFALYTKLTNSDSASTSLVQEKDVCPEIVHLIDKYMEDPKAGKLLQMGAMTFGNFAAVFDNAPFLRNSGSVDCILRMLKRHSNDPKVVIQCYRAIGNIALISEDMRLYLLKNGCEPAIRDNNLDDPEAEQEKAEALRHLLTPHVKKHKMMAEVDLSDFQKKTRLTKDVRNFLTQGQVVKIVKKDGERLEFHLFMTPDLKEIICKKPKKDAKIKQKWRLPLH